tara:strand:+ start:1415 stop:2071 length:657 start_codon:yes stop_codon:yes gene_type:complete
MKNKNTLNFINFTWEGTDLELHPNHALYIPSSRELLISDIHIGKGEYFQSNGVPLTNDCDESNIKRIYKLIEEFKPSKLLILGDLFHSRYSLTTNAVLKLEKLFKEIGNVELIEGNHDKGCLIKNISYLKEKKSLNLIFTHKPINTNNKKFLNICGHYHPKLTLKNYNDKLSFKCFALDPKMNILFLPSFGDLTGGYLCKRHFIKWAIISEKKIMEIK